MAKKPTKKKPKLDELAEAAATAWEHYRNYVDSIENPEMEGDEDGDTDELQELLSTVLKPHMESKAIQPLKSLKDVKTVSIPSLLPILISVAYYHLADIAIGECLELKQQEVDSHDKLAQCQELIEKSLHWYPENAAMWSVGANFGRMFQVLPPRRVCQWYEIAVDSAATVREESLKLVDDSADTAPEVKEWIEMLLLNHVAGIEYVEDNDDDEEEEKETEVEEKPDKTSGHKKPSKKRKSKAGEERSEEEDEDEEKVEDSDGYFSTSSVEAMARFMAAMLHSTAGNHDKAKEHLQHFPLTHRIHPNVWQPPKCPITEKTDQVTKYQSVDGILPAKLYDQLCQVFGPKAAYWSESDYNHRGYYSYFMDKPKESDTGFIVHNLMDDVIWNHLYPLIKPQSTETIVGAEWWVHTRSTQANLGHNLHFDTDEALLAQEGQITHPLYSSVLYLTGGGSGGATVVFDQTPDSKTVGEKAWRCVPEDNTLMVFNGKLLHGVLPCPGISKDIGKEKKENAPSDIKSQWTIGKGKEDDDAPHRLTLLVGFWTRRVPDKMKNRKLYGPCGPLPPRPSKSDKKKKNEEVEEEQQHSWVEELHQGYDSNPDRKKPQPGISSVPVPVVTPAWETLKPAVEEKENEGHSSALEIPRGIDHRFFVRDAPKCFRDSLFERSDEEEEEEEDDEEEGNC